MLHPALEQILPRVQKPARYVGGEWGSIQKNKEEVDLRFAFCFPDTYEVGMSHLGSRILYGLLTEGNAVEVNQDEGGSPNSWVEFGDFMEGTMDRKGVSRLQMRVVLEKDAEMTIFIQYDSEGTWRRVKHLTATKKQSFSYPVLVRRCDHYRLKIEGTGGAQIHSLARSYSVGSEFKSKSGRN